MMMDLQSYIGRIPNYPKPGILFYDISPLLAAPQAWSYCVRQLTDRLKPLQADLLVGIESRGFLLAAPLAIALNIGFVLVRKKGKLPGKTIGYTYDLEYGTDTLEIQQNVLDYGKKAIVVDDLLATGGTMQASINLLNKVGLEVAACACLIELSFLGGREKIKSPLHALMQF